MAMPLTDNPAHQRLLKALALGIIILWGLVIRLDDLKDWRTNASEAFHNEEPLIATGDGYYYLRLAQDLVNNRYNTVDELRSVPANPPRPFPPPLLSVMTAAISRASSFSLNWVAVVLPAVLGVMLAIPSYCLGKLWGGTIMGLTAAAFSLISNAHLARSSFGQYDTDCLNPTLLMAIVFFLLKFATETGRKRYYYLISAVATLILFLWWWDQAPYVVLAIFLVPFTTALVYFYRPPGPEAKKFILFVVAISLIAVTWQEFNPANSVFHKFQNYYHYIIHPGKDDFPPMGKVITEQAGLSLPLFVARSTGSWLLFGISLTGLILLFARHSKQSLFLIMPILLALLAFAADRFMIFITPVIALGFGFFMVELCRPVSLRKTKYLIIPGLIIYASWTSYKGEAAFAMPFPGASIAGMSQLQRVTPAGAIVWTFCDNGYPLSYWGNRGTTCDGQTHSGEQSVYNSMPLATENPRLAANFIQFYVRHGTPGINLFYQSVGKDRATGYELLKRIMAAGPQEASIILKKFNLSQANMPAGGWLTFLFPPRSRPVYLFLDWGLMQVNHWIVFLGTWDINKQTGVSPLPGKLFKNIIIKGLNVTNKSGTMHADLQTGVVNLSGAPTPITSALFRTTEKISRYDYPPHPVQLENSAGSYEFDIFSEQNMALLLSRDSGQRLFNNLFWLKTPMPPEYFKPVLQSTPNYQIWEVGGDTWR